MKKFAEFLKALGACLIIVLFLAYGVVSVVAELFPAAVPDWLHTALLIISVPFWIAGLVHFIKQWHKERQEKKNKHR